MMRFISSDYSHCLFGYHFTSWSSSTGSITFGDALGFNKCHNQRCRYSNSKLCG